MDTDNFPLPNDKLLGGIVVASVEYYNDDRGLVALVMLLDPEPNYYRVGHVNVSAGTWAWAPEDFPNIVPATEYYVSSGGDY